VASCRNCGATLTQLFVDLGTTPLSNAYVKAEDLDRPEPHFPLRPHICDDCLLVQLPMFETPEEIFGSYDFFSSQSQTWVEHCGEMMQTAANKLDLTRESRVLELASNDGALLRSAMRWTPYVTGVEPARNVAREALLNGLPTINRFFGRDLAAELTADGYRADLIIANNVLAHVPDLDDFVGGIRTVLADDGVLIIEVPSLVRLIEGNQFDTIYHEHFSYFTLHTLSDMLFRRGLYAFDLEQIPTHGGSLRVYAQHYTGANLFTPRINDLGMRDVRAGFSDIDTYRAYAPEPSLLKQRMLERLTALRKEGKRIAGYGAPAKATTFLSYVGLGPETIEFIVDSTPSKQGKYLPGARIPILHPDVLNEREPDVILILPWNWEQECIEKIKRDCPWKPMVLCRDKVLTEPRDEIAA
jgi:SAM-dependent methyltransferase